MSATLPRPNRSIVLVGLMGAGKTTVGRRLAARLRMAFVDSDDEIEKAAGRSISEIFAEYGEAEFRDGERRVIERLVRGRPTVIATGGGAFVNDTTRALINSACISIWLEADVETLAARVERRDHRPLLKGKDPRVVLRELSDVRNPFYSQAHIRVLSEPAPHDRTVDKIIAALAELEAHS